MPSPELRRGEGPACSELRARPAAASCGFGPDCGHCQRCECNPQHPNLCACLNDACDDGDACSVDVCSPLNGDCSHARTPGCCTSDNDCEDGNACTTSRCINVGGGVGVCAPQTVTNCDDGSAYTDDSCDPSTGACRYATAIVACGSSNDCPNPTKDICADGTCERFCSITTTTSTTSTTLPPVCTTIADCDDGNACTQDQCRSDGCLHLPLQNFSAKFRQGCLLVGTASAAYGQDSVILKPEMARAVKKFRKSCRAVDRAEHAHRIVPAGAAALRLKCGLAGTKTNSILENGVPIRGG